MSNAELQRWLEKHRRTDYVVGQKIRRQLRIETAYFVFWKKNTNKNKDRLHKIFRSIIEPLRRNGEIINWNAEIIHIDDNECRAAIYYSIPKKPAEFRIIEFSLGRA